jgi:hypothetical protein
MANKINTPKLFANIQMRRQKTPHRAVIEEAMLSRPSESLKYPIGGRPKACPKLKTAPMIEPWEAVIPTLLA